MVAVAARWRRQHRPPEDPCRAYGGGGSLRVPGRLNITWADDNTLKIDMDAGTQTRLLHFNAARRLRRSARCRAIRSPPGTPVRAVAAVGGGGGGGAAAPRLLPRWGSLQVVTTNMTGGYLLSSRAPYSENAVLTEHFTRHADFGMEYFTVTAIVEDGADDAHLELDVQEGAERLQVLSNRM